MLYQRLVNKGIVKYFSPLNYFSMLNKRLPIWLVVLLDSRNIINHLYVYFSGYEKNFPYIGVVVGRVAGRIAGGKFSLDGTEYNLVINNGPNNIHGGVTGFSRVSK